MVDKKKGVLTYSNQGEDQLDSQDETQVAALQPEEQLQVMLEQVINQMDVSPKQTMILTIAHIHLLCQGRVESTCYLVHLILSYKRHQFSSVRI